MAKMPYFAIAGAIIALTLTGCTDTPPSSGTGSGPVVVQPPVKPISLSQVWDEDGCLADTAVVNGTFVAGRKTNLCRQVDPNDSTFYTLYNRKNGPTNWLQMYSARADYTYWMYSGSVWFRAPSAGGATEILVNGNDGSTYYTDYGAWRSTAGNMIAATKYDFTQMARQSDIDIAQIQTYEDVTSTQAQLADAQAKIAEQQKQLADQRKQLDAQKSKGMTADEVKAWQMEWNNRMVGIFTQPECNFSYNGCR